MHLKNTPFDGMEPRIRVAQASILLGMMYMRQQKFFNQDEITLMAHPLLLGLHSIHLYQREINVHTMLDMTIISLSHSFLPTHKVETDLCFACFLAILCLFFIPIKDKDIIPILLTALPGVFYIGWNRIALPTVRFTDADKLKNIQLNKWLRRFAVLSTGLLIPICGINGVKALLLLVVVLSIEIQLMLPFMTPIMGERVAGEIAFLAAVSSCYLLHIVFLNMERDVWWIFQLIKAVPSMKLASHEPKILSIAYYFGVDYIEMALSSDKYALAMTHKEYALALVIHLCAYVIGMICIFVMDLIQQNKKLKENNTTLAMHCNLPTRNENASATPTPTPSVHDDEEQDYPSDNSHYGVNIFRPPSPNNSEANNSEASSSGRTSVPPLRMHGARRQLEQMTLERLTKKIQKLSRKVDEICAGDDVSSESTTSTMNSREKVTALKMELNATRQKMTDMMEVMNNRDMGAIEAMIELQRQTGIAPTVAVGVPCPSGHSGRADVIV